MILVDVRTANEQAVGMIPRASRRGLRGAPPPPSRCPRAPLWLPTAPSATGRADTPRSLPPGFPDVRNHEGVLMHTHISALVTPLKTGRGSGHRKHAAGCRCRCRRRRRHLHRQQCHR